MSKKIASKKDYFDLYWTQMRSRIIVGEELEVEQRDLFRDFGEYRIPMRYEPVIYEHEFSKLFSLVYNEDGESNSSDPVYCPAFRTLSLNTKLSATGTPVRAYLQIRLNIYNFNQDKSYIIKTGAFGFAAITSAAMSIQQAFVTSILATYMDVEIIAGDPDGELDSDNYFTVEEVLGFFG